MSEEIKRYDCEGCSGYCYGGYHMAEVGQDGDYVKAEDFDRVVAELNALRKAVQPFVIAFNKTHSHGYKDADSEFIAFLDRNTITPHVTVGDFRYLVDAVEGKA